MMDDCSGAIRFHHYKRIPTLSIIYDIVVAKSKRNQGFGRQLIRALELECVTCNRTQIQLKVKANNPANKFYDALKYKCIGQSYTRKGDLILLRCRVIPYWQAKYQNKKEDSL